MIRFISRVCARLLLLFLPGLAGAQTAAPLERVANTTLKLPAEMPVFGFTTTNAFSGLNFAQPVAIVTPSGESNRLFVVEKPGRIAVITNLANPARSVFLDISQRIVAGNEQGLLGLAFHPGFATNGFFYVFYTLNTTTPAGGGLHDRLSRFSVSMDDPNRANPASEQVMITQKDDYSNHNGGDLHFGPDGFLYVSVGDEGDQNDRGNNSQRIDKDFFAGLLRLDVDHRPDSLEPTPHPAITPGTYWIPADNPFVGATEFNGLKIDAPRLRAEFYAVGLRNAWRFFFDPATGWLYCGDVGGDAREEINIIVKGGNYGWAVREGSVNGPKAFQAPQGFQSLPPLHQYLHGNGTNQGNSVTGGVVYHGRRFNALTNHYIFADYVSGNIWALRYDGTNSTPVQRIARDAGIAAFGIDPLNGEVLMADHVENQIKRLVYGERISGDPLPETLADTGAFSDLSTLAPQPGVVPYEINVPFWSDGAQKSRWFSIPDLSAKMDFHRDGHWTFPAGTVWVKHFELELTNGVPESARRLETRFLVKTTNNVYGLVYRWDDSQTNATLVPEDGLDAPFVIQENGTRRTQVWRYPSRAECLACHTPGGGFALGFNTAQLNRAGTYGTLLENQIRALDQSGYFSTNVTGLHTLRTLVPASNHAASLETRTRSYLAANCAQCHHPRGPALGFFDARFTPTTAQAGLIHGRLNKQGGDVENRVIRPGWPQFSELLKRIAFRGPGQMPPIASTVVDTNAVQLLTDWIRQEAVDFEPFLDWQIGNFDDPTVPLAAPEADPDNDHVPNYLEYLLGTSPVLSFSPWRVSTAQAGDQIQIRFPHIARRGFEVQFTTNLLDSASWQALDVPDNAPFFSSTNFQAVVEDKINPAAEKYYRVRVFEQ